MYYASNKVNKVIRLADMILSLLRHIRHVDYVLIDTYSTLNFYLALIISQLCRLFDQKYIPNLNGVTLPARLKKSPRCSAMIFNNAYVNVSPSFYLKNAFYDLGYKNVEYIPNTIELKNYKFELRTFEKIKMLWVRSFSHIYNPELAVRILRKLNDLGFEAELCMIGPDSDGSLAKVKKLAAKLNTDVTFTGKLSKKEWIKLAANYNVFINTTNFDNTPVSVIEAMALGLPVVSTNVGGIPYLIEDHMDGVLVEKDNLDGMVEAVLNLTFDENFTEKIVRNAREKVEQFDWQVIKSTWFEILV
jgi:glycosyltransferase involved in cell wall biosynthesis